MTEKKRTTGARAAAGAAAPREIVRMAVGALDGHGSVLPDTEPTDARDGSLRAAANASMGVVPTPTLAEET